MSKRRGRLFVISAPSGAGKSTIISRLMQMRPELVLSVSATTRGPRAGERDGVEYHFVTRERFAEMVENGEFLEHAEYVGELYGTPAGPIDEFVRNGTDVLLEIEVQGAKQIMAVAPDAVTVFITPPDMAELERRLRGRGTDTEEKLAARLARAGIEFPEKDYYMHVVVNDDIDRAAAEIAGIIDDCRASGPDGQ